MKSLISKFMAITLLLSAISLANAQMPDADQDDTGLTPDETGLTSAATGAEQLGADVERVGGGGGRWRHRGTLEHWKHRGTLEHWRHRGTLEGWRHRGRTGMGRGYWGRGQLGTYGYAQPEADAGTQAGTAAGVGEESAMTTNGSPSGTTTGTY